MIKKRQNLCRRANKGKTMNMNDDLEIDDGPDEEILQLMTDYDVDEDIAEKAQELVDEGLDEDMAIELAEEL